MEKLLETNHYLVSFDFDEENLLLFNSDGGSLIVMEKKHFHDNRIETSLLSEKEIDTLVEMGFLIDNKKNHFRIIDDLNKKSDELVITIEVIDSCNLNCDYCYQLGWKPRGKIKKNVSGKIIRYIDSCLSNEAFRKLKIRFIGGEPLLAVDEIKYLYSKIHSICKANGVELKIGLDTNGIFLTYDILQLFDDSILDLSVTLISKEDHDLHRVTFGGNGTYDIIVSNLKKCKELFKKKNLNLYIRYNVNSENIFYLTCF